MKAYLLLLAIILTTNALSCSCSCSIDHFSIESFLYTDYVFIGKAITTEIVDQESVYINDTTLVPLINSECKTLFKVDESFKNKAGDSVWIYYDCETSCSMSFSKGETYLVYADNTSDSINSEIFTRYCSRTTPTDTSNLRIRYGCSYWTTMIHFYPKEYKKLEELSTILDSIQIDSLSKVMKVVEKNWFINDFKYEIKQLRQLNKIENKNNFKLYFSTGELNAKGNFKNGVPHGKWQIYYPNGRIKARGKFIAGKKAGKWVYFNWGKQDFYKLNWEKKIINHS